ncbi:hypothetical protein NDU88_004964 [Pleurodeles waltl]|uniref:Uncharacterized protein n=1 Tax=Pleurodeles waltl TaxID=8319 RepID=A0AAV7TB56_PLEWA|nr:hypothetical protein NDU88_004964 [Pleurodeles waltl]
MDTTATRVRLDVEYQPGPRNLTVFLSRHAHPATPQEAEEALETEEYIRLVVDCSRPLPIPLAEVVEATGQDDCLQVAMGAVRSGNWHLLQHFTMFHTTKARAMLQAFFHVHYELSMSEEGCLLRGPHLVPRVYL